jgi:hypothetical protein
MKHSLLPSAAFCLLFSACATAPVTPVEVTPVASVSAGQPCDVTTDSDVDTKGLVCHWYGEVGDRKGMWIVPEIPYPHPGEYAVFMDGWKTFTSPDGSFSLKYPPSGSVESFVEDETRTYTRVLHMKPLGDAGIGLTVEKIKNNGVTFDDRIKDITDRAGAARRTDDFQMNGVVSTRIDWLAKGSLGTGGTDIFVPKDGYYLHISGFKSGYTGEMFYEAFNEAVISSFTAK